MCRFIGDVDTTVAERLEGGLGIVGGEKQCAPYCPFGHQLTDLCGGVFIHRWRAGLLQQDLTHLVAGYAHGEPAHEPEVHVCGDLETELGHVEVECVVLVEDEDLAAGNVVEHVTHRRTGLGWSASPKLLGLVHLDTK